MSEAPVIGRRYRAVRLLADTAMTRVLEAEDTGRGDRVVVKIATASSPFDAPASPFRGHAEAFFGAGSPSNLVDHEGAVLRRLTVPGVAEWLDGGAHAGLPYVVTKFAAGARLDRLRTGAWPAPMVAAFARTMLEVLEGVHAIGVVHRDLKPANVLALDRGGGALALTLVDFELATLDGRGVAGLVGSARYRAPELTAAEEPALVVCDHRVDLYALGVMLYELLVGAPPFPDRATSARAHAVTPPDSVEARRGDVPPALVRLIEALLAKAPGQRPGDAGEALALLTAASAGGRGRRVPRLGSRELERGGWTDVTLAGLPAPQRQAVRHAFDRLGQARLATRDTPDDPSAWLGLARCSGELGCLGDALAAAASACRLAPYDPDAQLERGTIEARLEAWPEATACWAEAGRLAPGRPEPWAGRALALARARAPEAERALAAAVDSPLPPRWLARLARAAAELGAAGVAVAGALAADAADAAAGVTPGIVGLLIVSSASRPADADTLLPLAVACVQLALRAELAGRPAAATPHFAQAAWLARRGLAISPTPPDPLVLLHCVLAVSESGDPVAARRLLAAAFAGGLAGSIAARLGVPVPMPDRPSPDLLRLLALAAAEQRRLARAFVDRLEVTDAERGVLDQLVG